MAMTLQSDYPQAPSFAYAGSLIGKIEDQDIIPMINAEASASMPFGRGVVWKTSSPTTDYDVLIPTATTNIFAGIPIHFDQYARAFTTIDLTGASVTIGQLDGTGLRFGTMLAGLRRGKIWVICDSGCAVGDRLYMRALTSGLLTPGGFGNAADASNMIDCTAVGQWLSSAVAGGLAQLWIDLVNKQ